MKKIVTTILATGALAAGSLVPGGSASAATVQVSCGMVGVTSHHNDGGFKQARQMYTGPDFGCNDNGLGYVGDSVTYWCYLPGRGGTYTFLTDWTRKARGWVPDVNLINNGSVFLCDNH